MDPDNNQVSNPEIDNLIEKSYEYGFTTDIESETIAPGLNEDVIRLISKKKVNLNSYWIGDLRLLGIGPS